MRLPEQNTLSKPILVRRSFKRKADSLALTVTTLSFTDASSPTVVAKVSVPDPDIPSWRLTMGLVAPPGAIWSPPNMALCLRSDDADDVVRRPFRKWRLLLDARATLVMVGIKPTRAQSQNETNFIMVDADGGRGGNGWYRKRRNVFCCKTFSCMKCERRVLSPPPIVLRFACPCD